LSKVSSQTLSSQRVLALPLYRPRAARVADLPDNPPEA
jgi:hypothetical protein